MTMAVTPDEDRMCEQGLRYFGRVLAGQCHELVNALNIAHELCGLHEDTLPRATEGRPGAVEKLGGMARRIETQIGRCHAILRALGRFAHSVDEPRAECDAREIVERAVFFAARQARLRQTQLQAVLPEGDIAPVECSPFLLQQAIHVGIERLLGGVAEVRNITASLAPDPEGAVIALESADPFPGDRAAGGELAEIAALARAGGGELRAAPEGGRRLEFFIPHGRRDVTSPGSNPPDPGAMEIADDH